MEPDVKPVTRWRTLALARINPWALDGEGLVDSTAAHSEEFFHVRVLPDDEVAVRPREGDDNEVFSVKDDGYVALRSLAKVLSEEMVHVASSFSTSVRDATPVFLYV